MLKSPDISNKLAIDSKSIDDVRLLSKQNSGQALKEVAQQFEAIFLHMMLKSMRDATSKNGLFDSQQTEFYTQMLDQQMAQNLSTKGLGLADIMVEQLTRTLTIPAQPESSISSVEAMLATINPEGKSFPISSQLPGDKSHLLWPSQQAISSSSILTEKLNSVDEIQSTVEQATKTALFTPLSQPKDFVDSLLPHAKIASHSTGIPAHFMIAQAALESGWGKHEIRHSDNSPSHNLFGIKAGESWKGAVAEIVTTEYVNGVPQKMVEKFRAYDSYADGFRDYANLLLNNPRYEAVLKNQDANNFAYGLQRAGYATDPLYAEKLIKILNSSPLRDSSQKI